MNALDCAGRAWENAALNAYLGDWDVSEARDGAIEARADELLEDEGPHGCWPFGAPIAAAFSDAVTVDGLLRDTLPHLAAGNHADAGRAIDRLLRDFARDMALREATIQVDAEANDPSAAAERDYDERDTY